MVAFPDIAPVGICHLARSVHDASHDCYHGAFEMGSLCLDFFECCLEVIHRPAASWACDVFRLVESPSCGLHKFIREILPDTGCRDVHLDTILIQEGAFDGDFVQVLVKEPLSEVTGHVHEQGFIGRGVVARDGPPARHRNRCHGRHDLTVISGSKILCYRNFRFRILGKGNSNRISYPFR